MTSANMPYETKKDIGFSWTEVSEATFSLVSYKSFTWVDLFLQFKLVKFSF